MGNHMTRPETSGNGYNPSSAWVEEIFAKHEPVKGIPPKILRQAVQTMSGFLEGASDADTKRRVAHKIVHSGEVLDATFDIAATTPFLPLNMPQALCIGLLHDIGRLPHASLGEYYKIQLRHGLEGAKIVNEFDFSDTDVNQETVVTAIAEHDLAKTDIEKPYVMLIRDADKLALLRDAVAFFDDRYEKENPVHVAAPISPLVKADFLAGGLVLNNHLDTMSDEIVRMLAWITDISYPATRQLIRNEHLIEGLNEQLRTVAGEIDPEIQLRINELL
jgi:HD superfamily phosphodiesterase